MTAKRPARRVKAQRRSSLEGEVVLRGFIDGDPC
jgi:hypothetical protein